VHLEGYEVVRRIGRGGTGEVLEAVRVGPGGFRRPVALKRLYGDAAIRGDAVRRFFVEAKILAALDHPNIVRVLDVVSGERGAYIVMELLAGVTLAELAAAARTAGSPLPWPVVLAIADQALAGLTAAHEARDDAGRPLRLVHRDVTPRNLIVCDSGVVKLLDFGLAKVADHVEAPITREGTVHGTLELIAPEQASGDPPDAATDVYQVGATAYWALTGAFPHGTGTPAELIARAVSTEPAPVGTLREDLPAAVADVITRAMQRERATRFATAAQMRAAIAAAVGGELAAPAAIAAEVARWRARRGPDPEVDANALASGSTSARRDAEADAAATTERERQVPRPDQARRRRMMIAVAGAVALAGAAGVTWWATRPRAAERPRPRPRLVSHGETVLTVLAGDAQPTTGTLTPDGLVLYYATPHRLVRRAMAPGATNQTVSLPAGLSPDDVDVFPTGGDVIVTGQAPDGEFQTWRLGAGAPAMITRSPRGYYARLSPDGRSIAIARGLPGSVEVLDVATGAARVLSSLELGEIVSGVCWSPDGRSIAYTRIAADGSDDAIEIADVAAETTRVLHRRGFGTYAPATLAWPSADRIVFVVGGRDGATLYQIPTSGPIAERELHRWPALFVQFGRWAAGRLVYARGTARYGIYLHDEQRPWARTLTGDGVARRVAGWTAAGDLVFELGGEVVRQRRGEDPVPWITGAAIDTPDSVVDDGVVIQRVAGDALEVRHATAEGAVGPVLATVARRGAAANVTRCAGDRTLPCVIEVPDTRVVRYRLLDPTTGPGRVIAEVPRGNYFLRSHAVSPDGATLAIVDGTADVHLVSMADGARRELPIGSGVMPQSAVWSADGTELLVTAINFRGNSFAAIAVALDGTIRTIGADDALWRWRLQPGPGGTYGLVGLALEMDIATFELP
jgi:serine/threonine-protein kinase